MASPLNRIPAEVLNFFSSAGGHSLILRGEAGTGKTTLALQMIEELAQLNSSYYFSTRVSDYLLLVQFPWLGEKLYGKDIDEWIKSQSPWLGAEAGQARPPCRGAEGRDHEDGLNKLIDLYRNGVSILHSEDSGCLEDVRKVYEAVRASLPHRSLVVIDSLDALAERYGLSNASFVTAIQKDLVEGYGANVLFVLENNEKALDYLADGVIMLSLSEHRSRCLRQLRVQKLRGVEIGQPRYAFTLKGGRVQCFGSSYHASAERGRPWNAVPDLGGRTSTGLLDLDRLIKGGLDRGSVVLFEMMNNVPVEIIGTVEQSMVANFATQHRGVVWVPSKRATAEEVRSQFLSRVPANAFDKYVRIPEVAYPGEAMNRPYILPVEGSDAGADLKWDNLTYALRAAEAPYLSMLGFDTMESIYGDGVEGQLAEHIAAIKRSGGVMGAVTTPSTRSTPKLVDLATVHLRVERIDGVLVLYGEEPFTECNAVVREMREKGGDISLTPIV